MFLEHENAETNHQNIPNTFPQTPPKHAQTDPKQTQLEKTQKSKTTKCGLALLSYRGCKEI